MKNKTNFLRLPLLFMGVFLFFVSSCEKDDDNDIDDGINGEECVDADGNVYETVKIGDQEWMAENLRVTQYNNSDAIIMGLSHDVWSNTGQNEEGAYAIYFHENIDGLDSEAEVVKAYGKLYNWYAVDDARGLCPAGWRIPTDDDWTELVNYVVDQGYPNEWDNPDGAGSALKSFRQVDHPDGGDYSTSEHPRWNSHNTHSGFDVFAFSALPGGFRNFNGPFNYIGSKGCWWSSTEWSSTKYSSTYAGFRHLSYSSGSVASSFEHKMVGLSVRCVRDLVGTEAE